MRHARLLALATIIPLSGCGDIVRNRIYQPPPLADAASPLPQGAERIHVTTQDGLRLQGLGVPARAGRPTLLVFPGNASIPPGTIAWLRPLAEAGYGIVAAGYRGYDGNPGRPTETGLAADADAFYADARRRAGSGRLIVVGHSLGGGVAFGLAGRQRLDALVTVGTFSRMRAMAPRLARALVLDRYDNVRAIPTLDEPLFLVHALDDGVVPATEGRLLHDAAIAAAARGDSFILDDGGHRPGGTTIRAIVEAVEKRLDGHEAVVPAARFIPFG